MRQLFNFLFRPSVYIQEMNAHREQIITALLAEHDVKLQEHRRALRDSNWNAAVLMAPVHKARR